MTEFKVGDRVGVRLFMSVIPSTILSIGPCPYLLYNPNRAFAYIRVDGLGMQWWEALEVLLEYEQCTNSNAETG